MSAGARIRTAEPLLDKVLSLAPLARLGYPCNRRSGRCLIIIIKNRRGIKTLKLSSRLVHRGTERSFLERFRTWPEMLGS